MDPIGTTFTVLESVDSTNNYAMAQVHAGLAKHGDAYFSLEQTSGKGQRGKTWNTGKGENIALSCILQPTHLLPENQFMLSAAVALGCYDFVNHYINKEVTIKWPNDIYWRDRKAGGILIENTIRGNSWQFAIAGMGININQTIFPGTLQNPVSLQLITGISYDIIALAKECCNCLQARWELLKSNTQDVLEAYNKVLYKKDEKAILKRNNLSFETCIKGVDEEGALITFAEKEESFRWGEVEWVIG